MTHPLTPREKVARAIQAHDNDHVPDGYANGLSDEVSDWSAPSYPARRPNVGDTQ